MNSKFISKIFFLLSFMLMFVHPCLAADTQAQTPSATTYTIGVDDILDIGILKPDPPLQLQLAVSPDGTITFPYIGTVTAKGKTLADVQSDIQTRLESYMNKPVISISLRESRSRMYFVYGEVQKPGSYPMKDNLTAIRAISEAGGFTKYGSASKVKILRLKKDGSGNQVIPVSIKAVTNGDNKQDQRIEAGDVITVEEGIF